MEKRNAGVRGFTGRVKVYKTATIREFISGYAYPRNGNTHNPTPERVWVVTLADGTRAGMFPLVRIAKEVIDALEG